MEKRVCQTVMRSYKSIIKEKINHPKEKWMRNMNSWLTEKEIWVWRTIWNDALFTHERCSWNSWDTGFTYQSGRNKNADDMSQPKMCGHTHTAWMEIKLKKDLKRHNLTISNTILTFDLEGSLLGIYVTDIQGTFKLINF